jgi:hypothetical protein
MKHNTCIIIIKNDPTSIRHSPIQKVGSAALNSMPFLKRHDSSEHLGQARARLHSADHLLAFSNFLFAISTHSVIVNKNNISHVMEDIFTCDGVNVQFTKMKLRIHHFRICGLFAFSGFLVS